MKYITKDEYQLWESTIVNDLYDKKHKKTPLFPTDKEVSYVKQFKYIIFADFNNIKKVIENTDTVTDLPEKIKIKLYHIGKDKLDNVTYGYALDDKVFKHPGLDFGGLTNFWQEPHKKYQTYGNYKLEGDTPLTIIVKDIYNYWKKLMKKERFVGNIKQGLTKWLKSVQKILSEGSMFATIRLYKLETKHRILATQKYIIDRYGEYYIKTYDKDPNKFAKKIISGKNIAVIDKSFMNTNINRNNVVNEYAVY
jgi:hypothetical protein